LAETSFLWLFWIKKIWNSINIIAGGVLADLITLAYRMEWKWCCVATHLTENGCGFPHANKQQHKMGMAHKRSLAISGLTIVHTHCMQDII